MVAIELFAFARRKSVAEDNAVDVVSLVLEASPKGAPSSDLNRVPELIEPATGREIGAREVCKGAGKGKTAFAVLDELSIYPFRKVDNRIADDAGALRPYLVGAVVDEHGEIDADLLSCESCAVCGGVGSEHVCQQILEIAAEFSHWPSWRMKDRGAPANNRSRGTQAEKFRDRHDSHIPLTLCEMPT